MSTKPELMGVDMKRDELRTQIALFLHEVSEHFIQLHGGRGTGKSYTTQKTIIRDCLDNGTEFVFCVPTKKLKDSGALRKWVRKVLFKEFPEYQTKFTTEYLFMRLTDEDDWQLIGHCLALSGADNDAKNDSSIFKVNWMIWDEAMRIKLDVTVAERLIDLFLTAYHTIDRDENRVKAVFLGNALNKLDPVYQFFDVGVAELKKPGIVKKSFNKISWYVPVPPDLEEDPNNTFRQMIAGTRYGDIASGTFSLTYGHLLGDPGAAPVTSCYGVEFTEDGYLLIMVSCGIIYVESCGREFAETYATKMFTAVTKEATDKKRLVPLQLINTIRRALTLGRCKFVDEESLLNGSARLKLCYNISIL